jgi:nondiscriminating aspartyl-tRNA synthetase
MERILTSELSAHAGERVLLQGWLHRKRELSRVSFLVLRDRAGLAQVVVDWMPELLPESALEIEGIAVATDQAPGGVEVHQPEIQVLAEPAEAPPVELHRPEPRESLPTRLDAAAVALRHPAVRERFRLTARAVAAFRSTLDEPSRSTRSSASFATTAT